MILPASHAGEFDALFTEQLEADLRAKRLEAVSYIQAETVSRGPKLSGWFRGSVHPWAGDPGDWAPERDLPFYPEKGDFEVDAVVADAPLYEPAGVAAHTPHSNRLAHGWSAQAADGWTDVIVLEAAAL